VPTNGDVEHMLVLFDSGGSARYPRSDLIRLDADIEGQFTGSSTCDTAQLSRSSNEVHRPPRLP
jgi:hypothetical protein